MVKLKICSFNVNGISAYMKRKEIFHYLNVKQMQVILLQETHSCKASERTWPVESGWKMYFSHGSTNARGVATTLSKDSQAIVHNVICNEEGRYVIVYATIKEKKFVIANMYAPNLDNPNYFEKVFREAERFSPNYFLFGGDCNLALDPSIDRYGTHVNNEKSAKWLLKHIEEQKYIDVWRHFHVDETGYTCHTKNAKGKIGFSRLDYWFASEDLIQFINKAKIEPSFKSDHFMLSMEMNFEVFKRGPGYWKLNTSLVKDHDYVEKINKLLNIELENLTILEKYCSR